MTYEIAIAHEKKGGSVEVSTIKTTDPLSTGRVLVNGYKVAAKVAKLCRLGAITSLANEIQDCKIDAEEARPSRRLSKADWLDFVRGDLDPDGLEDVDWIFSFDEGKWTFCTREHYLYLSYFLATIEEYFVGQFVI